MRRAIVTQPRRCGYDAAIAIHRQCDRDIDRFIRAKKMGDINTTVRARLDVSRHVPTGVYTRGDDPSQALYAVLGVLRTEGCLEHARLFFVRYAHIDQYHRIADQWFDMRLTGDDEESFLSPVSREGVYFGPRFVRTGELVHAA